MAYTGLLRKARLVPTLQCIVLELPGGQAVQLGGGDAEAPAGNSAQGFLFYDCAILYWLQCIPCGSRSGFRHGAKFQFMNRFMAARSIAAFCGSTTKASSSAPAVAASFSRHFPFGSFTSGMRYQDQCPYCSPKWANIFV